MFTKKLFWVLVIGFLIWFQLMQRKGHKITVNIIEEPILYEFNQFNHSFAGAQERHVFRQKIYFIDTRPLNYDKTEGTPKA